MGLLDFVSGILFGPDKIQVDFSEWKPIFSIADSGSGYFFASNTAGYNFDPKPVLGPIRSKSIFLHRNLHIQFQDSGLLQIKLMRLWVPSPGWTQSDKVNSFDWESRFLIADLYWRLFSVFRKGRLDSEPETNQAQVDILELKRLSSTGFERLLECL